MVLEFNKFVFRLCIMFVYVVILSCPIFANGNGGGDGEKQQSNKDAVVTIDKNKLKLSYEELLKKASPQDRAALGRLLYEMELKEEREKDSKNKKTTKKYDYRPSFEISIGEASKESKQKPTLNKYPEPETTDKQLDWSDISQQKTNKDYKKKLKNIQEDNQVGSLTNSRNHTGISSASGSYSSSIGTNNTYAGSPGHFSGSVIVSRKEISTEEAYQMTISEIANRREELAEQYQQSNNANDQRQIKNVASDFLAGAVSSDLAHFWYGNPLNKEVQYWMQGSGRFAANYFVLSILEEAGFDIDKDKLVMKGTDVLIRLLGSKQEICFSEKAVNEYMNKQGKGVYILAFTDFIALAFNDGFGNYLIEVSSMPSTSFSRSPVIGASYFRDMKSVAVANLSHNANLISKWLLNKEVH